MAEVLRREGDSRGRTKTMTSLYRRRLLRTTLRNMLRESASPIWIQQLQHTLQHIMHNNTSSCGECARFPSLSLTMLTDHFEIKPCCRWDEPETASVPLRAPIAAWDTPAPRSNGAPPPVVTSVRTTTSETAYKVCFVLGATHKLATAYPPFCPCLSCSHRVRCNTRAASSSRSSSACSTVGATN